MAAEGDTRWIVSQRSDGRNVNGWHWEEADCTAHAKTFITEGLVGMTLATFAEDNKVSITKVKTMEMEAQVAMRKGKPRQFFECDGTVEFSNGKEGTEEVKGTIRFWVSQDEVDDFEANLSLDRNTSEYTAVYKAIKKPLVKTLSPVFAGLLAKLKSISKPQAQMTAPSLPADSVPKSDLPSASTPATASSPSAAAPAPATKKAAPAPASDAAGKKKKKATALSGNTRKLETTFHIAAPVNVVYPVFTNSGRFSALTAAKADIQARVGGKYSFFSGTIGGTFTKMETNKVIAMSWRVRDWPADANSFVTLTFSESDGKTTLHVKHDGIPRSDLERTREGWQNRILQRLSQVFGFNVTSGKFKM